MENKQINTKYNFISSFFNHVILAHLIALGGLVLCMFSIIFIVSICALCSYIFCYILNKL